MTVTPASVTMAKALNDGLRAAMENDPKVVVERLGHRHGHSAPPSNEAW